jgi:dihydroorotase-like cyclic amidohydrolase
MRKKITNVTIHSIVQKPYKGELIVEDGKIAEVGKTCSQSADEVIDGRGGLCFPD